MAKNAVRVSDRSNGEAKRSPGDEPVARAAAPDETADVVSWAAGELRAHPTATSVLLGCAGIGAAMVIGVGELAVGVALGYAAYLVLAGGESPIQALRDALALERGADEAVPATRSRRQDDARA